MSNIVTPAQPATKLTPPGTTGYVWTQTGVGTQAFAAAAGGGGYSGPVNSIPVGDGTGGTVNSGAKIVQDGVATLAHGLIVATGAFPPQPIGTLQIGVDITGIGFSVALSGTEYTDFASGTVLKGMRGHGTVQFVVSNDGDIYLAPWGAQSLRLGNGIADFYAPTSFNGHAINPSASSSIQATAGDVTLTGTSYTFGCPILPGPIDTTTIPGTAAGELVTDAADHKLYRWTGAAWLLVG